MKIDGKRQLQTVLNMEKRQNTRDTQHEMNAYHYISEHVLHEVSLPAMGRRTQRAKIPHSRNNKGH